ncbi:MAG: hypothetical protein LH615_04150 [Ferruginibacter sp.]|nr:hypothetical protein [Ferruginibacter sp.]
MINRKKTYENLKTSFGAFKNKQVEGFEAVFDEYEKLGWTDTRHLAYILATIWHEVNKTMQPIAEYGKGKGKDYGKRLRYNRKLYTNTQNIFYGRGHTQNTWIDIYENLTKVNVEGWDFVKNPDLLLQMKPSIWATFYAMKSGLYTGKKLNDYFNLEKTQPTNARRIINGIDKAELIAGYYTRFLKSIEKEFDF